jgi:phospholipid/cholesterol/gamma-HCH transport system ATP-binding protein
MSEPVIQVRDLRKRLGRVDVLRGVSFEVMPQEIFVIMGPSGTGKTVLLRHLVGLLRPDQGEIYLWDSPVHALRGDDLDRVRLRIGVVFQGAALFDSMTVGENVAFPLRRHRRESEIKIRETVATLLEMVGMEGQEKKMPAKLSGGMRKRVGIARALALNPDLVFYDEPTAGLDPPAARGVESLIARLRADLGVTSVIVTHDLWTAFGIGDRVAVLDAGTLLAVGTPAEIQADPRPQIRDFIHPPTVAGERGVEV